MKQGCDMAFIEPMHRNKPYITYLLMKEEKKAVEPSNFVVLL